MASMAATKAKLHSHGIETLAVVTTAPDRARTYFKFRPSPLAIGADPDLSAHRAFGIPQSPVDWPAVTVKINPTGELTAPATPLQAMTTLNERDSYQLSEADKEEVQHNAALMAGMFLIDQKGVVRWSFIEGAEDGLATFGKFPSEDEVLAAVLAAQQRPEFSLGR
jgi:hypothetical protein